MVNVYMKTNRNNLIMLVLCIDDVILVKVTWESCMIFMKIKKKKTFCWNILRWMIWMMKQLWLGYKFIETALAVYWLYYKKLTLVRLEFLSIICGNLYVPSVPISGEYDNWWYWWLNTIWVYPVVQILFSSWSFISFLTFNIKMSKKDCK